MLPIYVLNLDRAADRRARIGAALRALGLDWERVAAPDRLAIPLSEIERSFGRRAGTGPFPATPGDMACSLGHRLIWQKIAGRPEAGGVVLEDDARLAPGFAAFAAGSTIALMEAHGIGVLKIEYWPGPQMSRRFPLGTELAPGPGGSRIYRLRSGFLGSCGYVMTRRAAEAALANSRRMRVPADHFLFGRAAGRGFDALGPGFANPAPVLHDLETFASDIAAERPEPAPGPGRRLRDWRVRRQEAGEIRAGRAARVRMRFAGEDPSDGPDRDGGAG
ncbi:MAG: glycosyltransferase family 25 protein [Defluviimonas sp.]|uniref:glycosyltransferase family 25 protein n=1 Tax=Albidovulum sp. TaxID=1872424 RepID=UPI001D49E76A|nr:glycosyltransferase family 25 protein [Paracoccaceae bacterium]MCC0064808.1 glycosyltransferase family 25 protein [Defluviimonas sp.]